MWSGAFPELAGAWLTIKLSASALALGLCLAVICAYGKSAGPSPVRWLVSGYMEVIRNTPFLVQIFIFYFWLPAIGLRFSANTAALLPTIETCQPSTRSELSAIYPVRTGPL